MTKTCKTCGKEFYKPSRSGYVHWARRKTCSKKCMGVFNIDPNSLRRSTETVLCACGCGSAIKKYDQFSRVQKYEIGHRVSHPCTEETKQKISRTKEGTIPCNKGKKISAELIKKIKEGIKIRGYKITEEHRLKLIANAVCWNKGTVGVMKANSASNVKGGWTGEKNPNWKGGISIERERIRGSRESKEWQKAVLLRDYKCCQKCGEKRGRRTTVHHILNFATYPELRFVVDNGITFCRPCHKAFHKKYGVRKNNREQVIEFIYRGIETKYLENFNF